MRGRICARSGVNLLDSGPAPSLKLFPPGCLLMCPSELSETVVIRPFHWSDLRPLYDLMSRAGEPPYAFAPDPVAALRKDLEQPRMTATEDVWLAESGDDLLGWIRVDLELTIQRAVLGVGVDTDRAGDQVLVDLIQTGVRRARDAGVTRLHLPVPEAESTLRGAASALGFTPVRVYYWMQLDPNHADGSFKAPDLPESFSIRPMRLGQEEPRLAEIQNAAFTGMWGFAPNTVKEIDAKLEIPGCRDPGVLFAVDEADWPIAYVWTRFEPRRPTSTGFIGMVGVLPQFRRSGLGKAVTGAGVAALISHGAGAVWLEVDRENRAARKVYENLGFHPRGRTIWYGCDPST